MIETENETKEQKVSDVEVIEKTEKTNENEVKTIPQKEVEEVKGENEKKEKIEIKTLDIAKKEEKEITSIKKSKKSIIIAILVFILIISLFSTIFAIINLGSTRIMKGISIGKIDVSNLTKEEAIQVLNEIYSKKSEKQIYLTCGEIETVITYEALEVKYQIKNAVEEAYTIGRKGNIFQNNIEILKTWIQGDTVRVQVVFDDDMISQIAQNINNNIKDAVVQSSYYIENEKLIITTGKTGNVVDEKKLIEDIYEIVNLDVEENNIAISVTTAEPEEIDLNKIHQEVYKEVKDAYYTKEPFTVYPEEEGVNFDIENAKIILSEKKDEYEIPLIITKPSKTVKEIGTEAFPDLLATFSTKYQASNKNRTTNLKLATQKINGVVLLPGKEFSYNQIVGERTIQAGYKEAAVYSNGQVVNGLGGGICQISSTLYDAVVMANLKVTNRRNHQFVTSYLPAGKDATVVYGSQDFKFVNTRKYPIRIQATVNGGVATISIWGVKEDVEYDISIETKKVATIAYTTQYIQDPSLPVGKEVVQQAGSNGRKVEAYKVVKLNGQVVSKILLSKDTYNAMQRIVRVGTGGQ